MNFRKIHYVGIGIGCIAIVVIWLFFSNNSPITRSSALSTTRTWAQLAPYPESANIKQLEITGNMFTHGFIIEFEASPSDIQNWLKTSPGTKDVTPIQNSDGSLLYKIQPGDGAQFAELLLNKDGKTVRIRTYWS